MAKKESAVKARIAKAMAADRAQDLVRGIKENSPQDKRIDARVRAKARKG
jgi:hypothetical protein